jgi:hypothetical protein
MREGFFGGSQFLLFDVRPGEADGLVRETAKKVPNEMPQVCVRKIQAKSPPPSGFMGRLKILTMG